MTRRYRASRSAVLAAWVGALLAGCGSPTITVLTIDVQNGDGQDVTRWNHLHVTVRPPHGESQQHKFHANGPGTLNVVLPADLLGDIGVQVKAADDADQPVGCASAELTLQPGSNMTDTVALTRAACEQPPFLEPASVTPPPATPTPSPIPDPPTCTYCADDPLGADTNAYCAGNGPPSSRDLHDAVVACACYSCPAECSLCGATTSDTCNSCVSSYCGDEMAACSADAG
jgi:hypothetical protein